MEVKIVELSILNALSAVSLLFVTTLGLAIIFGVMGVVNLAHGEFLMIGAYASVTAVGYGLSPLLSLLVGAVAVGLFALLIEPFLIRYLYGKTMESILATFGLGIVIRQLIELIFGKGYHEAPYPILGGIAISSSVEYSYYRIFVMFIAIALAIAVYLIQRKTNFGTITRAVMNNPTLAATLGINVKKVYRSAFALGSAITGLGGALVAPFVSANPSMGLGFVAPSFLTILAGTPGSLVGLVGSSALLGIVNSATSYLADPVLGGIVFVLLSVLIVTFKRK
jgi:urea transport system permease protein